MPLEQPVSLQSPALHSRLSSPPSSVSDMHPNPRIQGGASSSNIGTLTSTTSSLDSFTPQNNTIQYQRPTSVSDANSPEPESSTSNDIAQNPDVDPQILEALRSKDRIYVLKLGELMENLINERRTRIELTPLTSYQRLLVHRCSAYYKLSPENDVITKGIIVLPNAESRIPTRRICELVPAEATTQPAFKIMRRSAPDRRTKPQSQAGSVTGEDGDLSDIEPSESGSLGGRSNATGGSTKKRMTIEEREAAYNEARSRIFMDFDKEKDKDMSASSSSLSLASGSASISGGASNGDIDETRSSPATESEWSGPSGNNSRERKDVKRVGNAPSSSAWPLRSNSTSFQGNNDSSSSCNSRAPSPSFTFATLYEPPPPAQLYDPSMHPNQQNGYHPSHPSQYPYGYTPHNQPPNPSFMAPYPFFAPSYGPYHPPPLHPQHPQHPQHSQQNAPDAPGAEPYPAHMGYNNPYVWSSHPPLQSPPQVQHPLPPQHQQPHQNHHPGPQSPQYHPPYMPPTHNYGYPVNYYPPQPPHIQPPSAQHIGAPHLYDMPRQMNNKMTGPVMGNGHMSNMGGRPGLGNGVIPVNNTGNAARNNIGPGVTNGTNGIHKSRQGPVMPPQTRSTWSYGPGVSNGGYPASTTGETVGPRLSSARRQNSEIVPSRNNRSSNCDEASSNASSSTSSSSRRTYTSTTSSSQHPLPARPDWAVGLKPQPTLAGRHHDHSLSNSRTMSPISPPRSLNGSGLPHSNVSRQQLLQTSPVSLQSTDFPPLTSLATTPEKRVTPVTTGAWGNQSSRSILSPSSGHPPFPGDPMDHQDPNIRLEDSDRGFERPPPKSAELYNPKVVRRPPGVNTSGNNKAGDREKEKARGDAVANAILIGQVASMSLEDKNPDATVNIARESPVVSIPSS